MRLDAHTKYPADYVRHCVRGGQGNGRLECLGHLHADRGGADGGGGCLRARQPVRRPQTGLASSLRTRSVSRWTRTTWAPSPGMPWSASADTTRTSSSVRSRTSIFSLRKAGGRVILDPGDPLLLLSARLLRGPLPAVLPLRVLEARGHAQAPSPDQRAQRGAGCVRPAAARPRSCGDREQRGPNRARRDRGPVSGLSALAFGIAAVRRRGESFRLLPRVVGVFATFHFATVSA